MQLGGREDFKGDVQVTLLRDDALAYSQRLSEAGNRVTHICFERQIHGFITMGKVIDEANTAVRLCADEVRRALSA